MKDKGVSFYDTKLQNLIANASEYTRSKKQNFIQTYSIKFKKHSDPRLWYHA